MDELISKQKVIDKLDEIFGCITKNVSKESDAYHIVYGAVDITKCMIMTIQPKRGKWIRDGHHIRCDQCGMYMCDTDREGDRIPTEFCPSCGADMRGEQNG